MKFFRRALAMGLGARITKGRRARPGPQKRPLQLEPLETRCLLSTGQPSAAEWADLLAGSPGFEGLTADEIRVQSRQIGEAGTVAVAASPTAGLVIARSSSRPRTGLIFSPSRAPW